MPPSMRLALTSAGRAGSLSVTETRSAPDCVCVDACSSARACICDAPSAKPAKATAAAKMYGKRRVWLFMVFEDTDVSIQIFDFDFRATGADARGGETVGVIDDFSAVVFFLHCVQRHSGHRKIAIDAAVEGLEAEVGGEASCKEEIDVAVDRLKAGILARVLAKADFDGAIDGVRQAGAGHAIELDVTVHVARDEIAGDVVDDDAAFIHGFQLDIDIAGDVEHKIHFDDVAVLVATAARALAAVFTLAAERAVNV